MNNFRSLKVSAKYHVDPNDILMCFLTDGFEVKAGLRNGLAITSDLCLTDLKENWERAKNGLEPKSNLEV